MSRAPQMIFTLSSFSRTLLPLTTAALWRSSLGVQQTLTDTAVKSAGYTCSAGENVICDANAAFSSGTLSLVSASSNTVAISGFTYENDAEFYLTTTGTLPGGGSLTAAINQRYWTVLNTGVSTRFSLTRGGSEIDILAGAGSGTNTAVLSAFTIKAPASPSTGDRFRVTLRTAHSVRTVMVDFNGGSWRRSDGATTSTDRLRLIAAGEFVEFLYDGTYWVLWSDGRRPQYAEIARASTQSFTDGTWSQLQLSTSVVDAASMGDTTNYLIRARRTCYFDADGKFPLDATETGSSSTFELAVLSIIAKNGTTTGASVEQAGQTGHASPDVYNFPTVMPQAQISMSPGDYITLLGMQKNTGTTTYTSKAASDLRPRLRVMERLLS